MTRPPARKCPQGSIPLAAGALLAGLMAGPGCIDEATRAQMAKSDSILGGLSTQPSPREAAAWATDPYDADKRGRGTTLILNAPFGGAEAWLALYRGYLKDPSPGVRAAAARGLGLHGGPDDVPSLVPLLKDPEKSVRLDAVKAMQRLHNPAAVDPLIDLTRLEVEVEGDVRGEAASALGQYAEPKVVQALIAALGDDQLVVSSNALASLRTLTGNDELSDDRKVWSNWARDNKAMFAKRREYFYPVFHRDSRWLDYVPFIGGPAPNEESARPAGMPEMAGVEDKKS